MPRPGDPKSGGNLDPTLWIGAGNAGIEAKAWFDRRMREGVKVEDALKDSTSRHPANLAMVNVEAVHTRWVHDLGMFLEAVDEFVYTGSGWGDKIAESMREDEREMDEAKGRLKPKKIEGVGWVVELRGYTDHREGVQFIKKALLANLQNMDKFATAKDENKIGKYIVGVPDPVKGKVSHAFLFKYWQVDSASANTFININESYLDMIVGGETPSRPGTMTPGAFGSGPPPGPPGTATGETPSAAPAVGALGPGWSGLTAGGSAAGTSGVASGMREMFGRGASSGGRAGVRMPSTLGGKLPVGGSTGTRDPGKEDRRRYEFIVMLIWREPVPKIEPNPDAPVAPVSPVGGDPSGDR
jgi:hypothetical protein